VIEKSLTGNKALTFGLLAATFMATGLLLMVTKPAHAVNSFTVNNVGDAADLNTADNVCDAFSGPGQRCTLRAAIQQANATPNSGGSDLIKFAIPGNGVRTIKPNSQLPTITEVVTIDGYTQPGASANTNAKGALNSILKIELDGTNAGPSPGLKIGDINSGDTGSVVRGLVINRFANAAGIIITGRGTRIEGNFIGTDPSGTQDLGNGTDGVQAGFSFPNQRTTIGGTTPEARNLISGNTANGIFLGLAFGGEFTDIQGNQIGTKRNGTDALGNGSNGVVLGRRGNTVGGATPGAANTIAFNGKDGVTVVGGTGNSILRNSIFSNAGLGIDLDDDGPTANNPGDADTGPNNLQNKPNLISAVTSGGVTTIKGNLNSTPNGFFVIRFFSNPSGNEGKVFRGQKSVSTNSNGDVAFSFSPATAVREGQTITATATSSGGDTSEFSAPRTVAQR
jgi:hypothetical protein